MRTSNAPNDGKMRKIVAGLFISLDGVVESPEQWGFQYFNDELTEMIVAGIAQADAVLLGPRTRNTRNSMDLLDRTQVPWAQAVTSRE